MQVVLVSPFGCSVALRSRPVSCDRACPHGLPAAQQHSNTDTAQQHDVGCSTAVNMVPRPVPIAQLHWILPCGLPSEDCAQCLPYSYICPYYYTWITQLHAHTTTRVDAQR